MATTKRKTKKKKTVSRKRKPVARRVAKKTGTACIGLAASEKVGLEMEGESLTVKLSRKLHPEVFDIDRMVKQIKRMRESYKGKRKMRDFCDFSFAFEASIMLSVPSKR